MKKSAAKKPSPKRGQKPSREPTKPTKAPSKPSTSATVVKGRQQAPESSSKKTAPPVTAAVHADHQRRTAIEFDRDVDQVRYVSLDVESGLSLSLASPKSFDDRFKPMVDYPVGKAAALYVEYARNLGATEQVMRMLGKLTNVTHEDIEMAAKKKAARAAAPVKADKKPAKAAGKAAKAAPVKDEKKATKPAKAAKAPGEKKERGPTAAKKFQELLMQEGSKKGVCKHTDDEIFAAVQKEFGLDDGKRSYVKWYRNYLTKQGQNPPAAKE